MSSTPRIGVVLADSRYESEENAYVQRRLVVFYGVVVVLAGTLYVAGGVLWGLRGVLGRSLLEPARLVHLAATLLAAAILWHLRRRKLGASALLFFDALGLHVAVGTTLAIYALDYRLGPHSISAILALVLIARAVVVPCSARCTLLLSLPAPLGVLAVQLAHGKGYAEAGVEMTHEYFVGYVVWNQVVLLLAAGIATLSSRITFGLRHLVQEATKLGQYRLEERIGKGSMGEVFRGQHAMLRRPTAIKVIHPEATDPELLQRFEREVRQTARLSHPNTVQIFDYGRTPEGAFYYAMEYLDGADLRRIVEESGPMPAARVIHVLEQACGALKEAHDAGLVHRDVKPGNIVLCRRGGVHDVVKLVDFGLVKDLVTAAPGLTQVGQICGTPETIAPEVLASGKVTPAADLYALGVVGYYLLTGRPIFDARSATDMIGHHLHTAPIPPRERRAEVPEDLEAVILRCLAKNPSDRFAGCGELRQALKRCVDAGLWSEKRAAAWWEARAKGRPVPA